MNLNILRIIVFFVLFGCESKVEKLNKSEKPVNEKNILIELPSGIEIPEGKIWIPGGEFYQGAMDTDSLAMNHEYPKHKVIVDGFLIDINEVTNKQFSEFVKETGYVTVAERKIDWDEIKKQLLENTSKPHDSILQPGALIFKRSEKSVPNLFDFSQWWTWKIGANWKHPNGPESSIEGKEDYPVVHIAYEDAEAYCEWEGSRLPTEAEWEYASRGGTNSIVFTWGNNKDQLSSFANTWEGEFPVDNTEKDGFVSRAPVRSYPKNRFGLYDMAGNVWEWTSDWYNTKYYEELHHKGIAKNPKGAIEPFNQNNPLAREKVIKGGSFLCSDSYCASYRISARMGTSLDTGTEHLGFRTVIGANDLIIKMN